MTQESVWGGVSDPSSHNEESFRYLIHAFNPFVSSSMRLINAQHALAKQQNGRNWKVDPSHGDQTINLYEQPERVLERVSLSMSLIDQDHTGTWGDGGIIIEVPEKNIVATSNTDMGSMNSDPDFLRSQFACSAKYSGDGLMQVTAPIMYNEVVAFANVDGSKIALKGFFYKTDRHGEPLNEIIARQMEMHASRLGLPVVKVQTPGMFPKNEIKQEGDNNEKIAVHLDGCRYLLAGYDDRNFKVVDGERMDFAAPQDMEKVLSFLKDNGYDDSSLNEIREAHAFADQERQKAKVTFDDHGNVESVKKEEGYGRSQTEYVVTFGGDARRVNVEEEIKKLQESMFGNGKRIQSFDDNNHYSPMSRQQVEGLISEACETLSEEDRQKVTEWASKILPDVEQKSQQAYGRRFDTFGSGRSTPSFDKFIHS